MAVNLDKPQRWQADIAQSVDMYNDWFMRFAPEAFRNTRLQTTKDVEATLRATGNLTDIRPETLRLHPEVLPTLRMSTCPPLAVDRLIGLAGVSPTLVKRMELEKLLPMRMNPTQLDADLQKIATIIERLADPDIFVWLKRNEPPSAVEIHRAATIVADRLCGSVANPIIRNAQEKRQLAVIGAWLEARGYRPVQVGERGRFDAMLPGTFSFRLNVPVKLEGGATAINIPVDAVIMPKTAVPGDFTNVNKRRKEEKSKVAQLRYTYGTGVRFNLFLCGYFNPGYLGFSAADLIDWVWEHRLDDLAEFGL